RKSDDPSATTLFDVDGRSSKLDNGVASLLFRRQTRLGNPGLFGGGRHFKDAFLLHGDLEALPVELDQQPTALRNAYRSEVREKVFASEIGVRDEDLGNG